VLDKEFSSNNTGSY